VADRLNLVRVGVSGTPGTGTITLGSVVSGFLTMAQAGAVDGRIYDYAIESNVSGGVFTQREVGLGVWNSSGNTLTRLQVRNSTNSNNKISVATDAHVIITLNSDPPDAMGRWLFTS